MTPRQRECDKVSVQLKAFDGISRKVILVKQWINIGTLALDQLKKKKKKLK